MSKTIELIKTDGNSKLIGPDGEILVIFPINPKKQRLVEMSLESSPEDL